MPLDTMSTRGTTTGRHTALGIGSTGAARTAIGDMATTTITSHVRSWGRTSRITARRRPTMGQVPGVAAMAIHTRAMGTRIVTVVPGTAGVTATILDAVGAADVDKGAAVGD